MSAMTEFKIGDIVRLTKGEPDKPGYRVEVRTVTEGISESPEVNLRMLGTFENAGWTVELIGRPAPPLPTTPNSLGWATCFGKRHIARLDTSQTWDIYDSEGDSSVAADSDLSDFTEAVLIPKDLANKVMEWACDEDGDWAEWYADTLLQKIAEHLKDNERDDRATSSPTTDHR